MTFKEASNPETKLHKIPIDNIHQNIVGLAIAEGILLKEFTYAIKGVNPICAKNASYKKNKDLLLKKVVEIARFFKVGEDDILADDLRFDKAKIILQRYYKDTLSGNVRWIKKQRKFETRDVVFSERSEERIVFDPYDSRLIYRCRHEMILASYYVYGYCGNDIYGVCRYNSELLNELRGLEELLKDVSGR